MYNRLNRRVRMKVERFILASSSPRRQELLKRLGFEFDVVPASVSELAREGESPRDFALRMACEKAGQVADRHPKRWVVAADTVVLIDGEMLGKPQSEAEAVEMLSKLRGRTHIVATGFCITRGGGPVFEGVVESRVEMVNLSDDEVRWYVSTGEPLDKAGAYGVQGIGAMFIKRVVGSYTNVVGLPLAELIEGMKKLGIVRFEP